MAGKWNGFTEDDIRKIQKGELIQGDAVLSGSAHSVDQVPRENPVRVAKRQTRQLQKTGRKNVTRERMLQAPQQTAADAVGIEEIPENARLSRLEIKVNDIDKHGTCSEKSSNSSSSTNLLPTAPSMTEGSPDHAVLPRMSNGDGYETSGVDINESKGLSCSLDEFRERQKLMEEQNRQRKQLLSQVLADRKKRTKEEARRLQQIQDELQKLDQLLSNDVSILRNQIESASIEFMEAQKRYDKAEKEFLDAKLVLFGKLERKELLTEHLCKIIEQNELRKARKLSELMDKLDLGISVQQPQPQLERQDVAPVVLAPVFTVDEVTSAACIMLKPRPEGNTDEHSKIVQNVEVSVEQENQLSP